MNLLAIEKKTTSFTLNTWSIFTTIDGRGNKSMLHWQGGTRCFCTSGFCIRLATVQEYQLDYRYIDSSLKSFSAGDFICLSEGVFLLDENLDLIFQGPNFASFLNQYKKVDAVFLGKAFYKIYRDYESSNDSWFINCDPDHSLVVESGLSLLWELSCFNSFGHISSRCKFLVDFCGDVLASRKF